MRQAIRWLLRWHRRRCARLPCAPLAVLLALALPLSCWASPLPFAHSAPRVLILAASIGLSVALAGAARRRPQADAQRLDAATWLYLALGVAVALAGGALPANERAGILLLFTPLAVAVACAPPADTRAAWRRLQLATLALLLLAASIDAACR